MSQAVERKHGKSNLNSSKKGGKNLDRLRSAIFFGMLGIATEVQCRSMSFVMDVKEVSELCSGRDALAGDWQSLAKQFKSYDQAVHSRRYGCIVSFSPLALFSCEEHYNPSILSYPNILAALITEKSSWNTGLPFFLPSRPGLM